MTKKFEAILFDLDGTLIDSMKDNYLAWKAALGSENIPIGESEYYPLEGMPVADIAKKFLRRKSNSPEKIMEIVGLKNKFYRENHTIKFFPYVQEFVDKVKLKGYLTAIVSASPHEKLYKTVPKEFLDKFDCLISGDCTRRGKPYPDPYLTAAGQLKLNPLDCIVIENAPLGVESAKNANMFCIAIGSTVPKEELKKADIFVNKFGDLINLTLFQ